MPASPHAFGRFATRWLESTLAASDRRSSSKTLYAGLTRTHILDSDLASTPLKRLRPTLRHTAASVMLSNGEPIPVVSRLLGHSGIAITVDVYGRVSPEVSRDALSVLTTALSDAASPV